MQNRIKDLRLNRKLTQKALAQIIGVAQNTLSYWEQGKYDIDNASLKKMADYFCCSVDYLLNRAPITNIEELTQNYYNIRPIRQKKIPLLGEIACGEPRYAEQQYDLYVDVSDDLQADFCLIAHGDSMVGARIYDGDIVFIRTQPMVENDEIAAVIIGEEATLKRVSYFPDKNVMILKAENPKYPDLLFSDDELNDIRILGKAIAFQSNIRKE